MKKSILFSLAALALAATACYKPLLKEAPAEAPKNLVRITVSAEKEIGGEDPESKVTYDPSTNKFGFDSDDKLQLLIGAVADDAITAQKNVILDMDPNHLGTFTGTIDLGDYALSDIRGAFLVKSAYSNANLFMNGTNLAMRSYVVSSQTQSAGDVFTSGNGRAIFYTHIKSDWVHQQDDEITIDHLTLKLGSAIWEFHIYGADRTDEKIKSVQVAAQSNTGNAANYTGCQEIFLVSNGNYANYGGNKYFSNTVTLTNPVSVGAEANSSPSIWLGIVGLGPALKTGVVTIITDKAIYTRDFDGAEKKRERGAIYPFNINIGSTGSFTRIGIEYSVDGGNTWTEWIDKLPDDVTTYTSLSLRQSHVALTADHLTAIKDWIKQQSNPVSLDLSGIKYTDTTFPDTFKGTSAAPYDKLKSISFPSNVITMAASAFAYCSSLETADLTGIEYLTKAANGNYYAFANSGLKTITFPSTFKGPMERSFVSTYQLESIYWNTPWNPGTSQNWRTFQWGRGNNSATDNTPKSRDLVLYIGAGARGIPMNGFRNNHNLTRVVVEASSGFKFYNNCFANCDNLAVFELKGALPPVINNANVYTDMSKSVTAANRKIIIPKGATAAYEAHANWAAWETMATALGFTVEEAAE